jgi:hypothetical protein
MAVDSLPTDAAFAGYLCQRTAVQYLNQNIGSNRERFAEKFNGPRVSEPSNQIVCFHGFDIFLRVFLKKFDSHA